MQPHAEVVPMQVDKLHAEGLKKLCQREVLPGDPEIQEGFRPAMRFRVSGKSPPSALHGKPSAEVSDGGEKPSEVEDLSVPRNRLRDREDHELFVHRLQGHASYDPRCDHCVCSRGVKQHRRRQGESDIEVAVDLGFVEASEGGQHKVLCMSERASGALGFVFCGANYETTCSEVLRWFQSIGITGPSRCTVLVRADCEPALKGLMRKAVPCRVEEVGPQVHEQVGAAERAVRSLKERLACLKLDLMHEGFEMILY